MYGTYGVGLTSILWISLIYNLFYGKKENKVIAIFLTIITCIPIFSLILNGGLYQNGKCFIPLIPLYLLLIGEMINNLKEKKLSLYILIPLILSFIILKISTKYQIYIIIDFLITFICLYIFSKNHKLNTLIFICIISFITFINTNKSDTLISIDEYKTILENQSYDIENYINLEDSIYRIEDNINNSNNINFSKAKNDYRTTSYSSVSNPYYSNAFYNTFNNNDIYRNKFMFEETNNLFFERFMGVKYLLTDKNVPYGYSKIKEYENGNLYENSNVYPIGFSTNHILNKNSYDKLEFNEQLEAYQIVNDNSSNAIITNKSSKINLDYQVEKISNLTYEEDNNIYKINSQNNGNMVLKLDEEITDKVLIIRFNMNNIPSCKIGDTSITINGITNKLTCKTWKYYNNNETFDYVISSNDSIEKLDISFTKGNYNISDILIYEIPKTFFDTLPDYDTLNIESYKGDILTGNINVKNDGYFIFTIPYDKGFSISIDNENVDYTIVNDCFIGFKISKGYHNIKVTFNAPLFKEGKIISLVTIFVITTLIVYEKKHYN
jgi:uncharacterized membrane protein YfhO